MTKSNRKDLIDSLTMSVSGENEDRNLLTILGSGIGGGTNLLTTVGSGIGRVTDLLIILSRVDLTAEDRRRAEVLCGTVTDWDLFADLAVRHGVAALVWRNICDLGLSGHVGGTAVAAMAAGTVMAAMSAGSAMAAGSAGTADTAGKAGKTLENAMLKTIARVTYITSAAAEIIQALEKAGIRVLMLKGLALEHSVYGSRGLRQMSDADLLVSPADALRAREVIESLGFESRPLKSPLYRRIILDLGNHLPEMHRGGISVDLHHRLFGARATGLTEKALNAPASVTAAGMTCNVLPPRINFLSLVAHLQKHDIKGEFQLRLYCDIYLLLLNFRDEILTADLMEEARAAGIEQEVRETLYLIKILYDFYVPAEFTKDVRPESIDIQRFLVNLEDPGNASPVTAAAFYRRNLSAINGTKRKLIFIAGDMFPSVSFMKKRYGRRSVAGAILFYPHRLGKLWVVLKALKGGKIG